MFKILRHTTLGMLLLSIMPLTFWLSEWHWNPCKNDINLLWLFIIMQTVNSPWVILTNVLLSILMFKCLPSKANVLLILIFIINITIVAGQQIKSFIKYNTKEPRPYVIWLESNYGINSQKFYQLKIEERRKKIVDLNISNKTVPIWLKQHWIHETDFSFPSGHTIFVSSWALLVMYFLWPYRYYKTILIVLIWAYIIMASRLLFGMHWVQDLVVANILSWILVNLMIYSINYLILINRKQ
ncbi:phosphatidylglycerophosphatase B [Candidatus Pantoea edessiphila]|uniref:undecaprenyl-diphosphate phosphatase n=1 Tax=Candidatus Pantoea edessiphila TaxID=2044610 RepID=A0A2P5T0R1_9GAMM|nr:phosphatase PAP2 family protein [Candidatus Pantoea edessiphila]PPI88156.1 phosphatidylglycerophosphatase B [Candidatus Pantoea edessiphila]